MFTIQDDPPVGLVRKYWLKDIGAHGSRGDDKRKCILFQRSIICELEDTQIPTPGIIIGIQWFDDPNDFKTMIQTDSNAITNLITCFFCYSCADHRFNERRRQPYSLVQADRLR